MADPWGYTYNSQGYMITFNGKPVGGAGTLGTGKGRHARANARGHKESAEVTLRQCREYHKKNPFKPSVHKHIWAWMK